MMIFKIAKTDLRNLFYSPVAWFLTIAFWIQSAYFYMSALLPQVKLQDIAVRNNPHYKGYFASITQEMFLNPNGIFTNILQNLYLFVPLLTMDLISREINNGTIKLLYSSPIKTRDIVLGKYLAIMLYNLLLVGIVGIFMLTGFLNIQSAEYGLLLSAVLGFYLLVCAYTAIGLFMSSLSNYPVVSAIGSFIVIFILGNIGTLWQQYDFVRDLTYFLSIAGRTGKMLTGLITTKDIIYFVIVVYIFVGFTWLRLKGARDYQRWYVKVAQYALVFVSALLIGYVSSRPGLIGYWDTTAGKMNTLRENTQQIIKDLGDEPMEATLYTNLLTPVGSQSGYPEKRNDYLANVWDPYLRFKSDIKFKYVYYYDLADEDKNLFFRFPGKNIDQIAAEIASGNDQPLSRFMGPKQIRKEIDLKAEGYRMVIKLTYKGRTTFLRTYMDSKFWPRETQVAAAFKRLLKSRMPKVVYLTGDLERSVYKFGEREYSGLSTNTMSRGSLVNNGFDIDTLSLHTGDIPNDVNIVVLADPKTMLTEAELNKLQHYIDRGGNLLVTGEPGKQEIINPVLAKLGVKLRDGSLVRMNKNYSPDMVMSYITPVATGLAEHPQLARLKMKWDTTIVRMLGAAPIVQIDSSSFSMKPLLMTEDNKSWLTFGKITLDSVPPSFDPAKGDIQEKSFITAAQLTRKINNKEQRIIVCGDADFMSNSPNFSNFGIDQGFYSWMDYNEFPIYSHFAPPLDDRFTISYKAGVIQKVIYLWVIPVLLLLAGIVLLVRRRRQ